MSGYMWYFYWMLALGQALYMYLIWKVDWLSYIGITVETDFKVVKEANIYKDTSWLWKWNAVN